MARPVNRPDNPLRIRIVDYLGVEPGAALNMVAAHLGVHHSTAAYHVRVLELARRVATIRAGRWRRAYVVGSSPCPVARGLMPRMDRPFIGAAVRELVRSGAVGLSVLRSAGATAGQARWALKVLTDAGAATMWPGGFVTLSAYHVECVARLAGMRPPPAHPLRPCPVRADVPAS